MSKIHKLEIEVDEQKLYNVLLSAGAYSHYWCRTDRSMLGVLEGGTQVIINDDCVEPDNVKEHWLTLAKLFEGLKVCARDTPYVFGKFLENSCDGPQADIIVQQALFGKVRFG